MAMSSIQPFDFRVAKTRRRRPRFEHQLFCEFLLPGSLSAGAPGAREVFATFRTASGIGSIYTEDRILDSDPRKFSKIRVYACAIRRGELLEFEARTGLRFAGPTAATLVEDAGLTLPPGTVFPGFTCFGTCCTRSAWITLMNSFRSGTGREDADYSLARYALAGSAKVNFIACVE